MTENSMNFGGKKVNRSNFYKKKNRLFKIDDIDFNNRLVFKKESYDKKAHLNTLLDIMIMMALDHYV